MFHRFLLMYQCLLSVLIHVWEEQDSVRTFSTSKKVVQKVKLQWEIINYENRLHMSPFKFHMEPPTYFSNFSRLVFVMGAF